VRKQLLDKLVDRAARFDHEHDAPRFLKQADHLFDGMAPTTFVPLASLLRKSSTLDTVRLKATTV
jgi:hypothetical protein